MSDVTFVTSRVLSRDSLEYILSVYRNATGFFISWNCKTCGYEYSGVAPLPDCDMAMAVGRVHIEKHHAYRHSAHDVLK
jgi:hypothetical protein